LDAESSVFKCQQHMWCRCNVVVSLTMTDIYKANELAPLLGAISNIVSNAEDNKSQSYNVPLHIFVNTNI
jgi:hypothetical protein